MDKSYCQFINSGGSWLSFPEPEEDSESEGEHNNDLDSRQATLLPKNEMHLYGQCPANDSCGLVTCDDCGKIMKMPLFKWHCELYHEHLLTSNSEKTFLDIKRKKHLKVYQPKVVIKKYENVNADAMDVDTVEVKIEEIPLIIPKDISNAEQTTEIHSLNHVVKKITSTKKEVKDSTKKFVLTKDREYDPNRHCGVWIEDQQKNCTRSLTCKTHALSLRRAVPGRIKKFDVLLLEHRERVNIEKEQQLLNKTKNSSVMSSSSGNRKNISNQSFGSAGGQLSKGASSSLSYKSQHSSSDADQSDLQYLNAHPKPLACCNFGARRAGPGHFVFNRKSDHLRTAVFSMVEQLIHPSQSRRTVAKHSVYRRYTTKTAGQSSNQGSTGLTDSCMRSRGSPFSQAHGGSTVFRNSNKLKASRTNSTELISHSNKISRINHVTPTTSHVTNTTCRVGQQSSSKTLSNVKKNTVTQSHNTNTSQIVHPSSLNASGVINTTVLASSSTLCPGVNTIGGLGSNSTLCSAANTTGLGTSPTLCSGVSTTGLGSSSTFGGGINNVEMGSNLTIGNDVINNDPIAVSVAFNGQIGVENVSSIHRGSSKSCSPVPSPRGSCVIPTSPSPPASGVYKNSKQALNQTDASLASRASMSPATVYQRQSSGGQAMSPLLNGTASSPSAVSKGYTCVNYAPKSPNFNNRGVTKPSNVANAVSNVSQGQNVVFGNTCQSHAGTSSNSSQITNQMTQDKNHGQNNLFQRPLPSPGRSPCQPLSPQIPSPGCQSPQRSPGSAASPKYQHSMYLNHQHGPVSSQAPIAQLKQQVENQGQQLQQIKFHQLKQQQQVPNPAQSQQHKQQSQFRAQQRITPATMQSSQQTTYLLQQSPPNHAPPVRPANVQVFKTSNAVYLTNDNPPREMQFSLNRNATNPVG